MAALPIEEDRLARAALTYLSRPGDPHTHYLITEYGPITAYQQLHTGISGEPADDWRDTSTIRRAHAALHTGTPRLVIPGDPDWPERLDQLATPDATALKALGYLHAPPVGLWVTGTAPLSLLGKAITIVGARAATAYGVHVAADIAAGCAQQGHPVLAGGGFGIDAAAHRGALAVHDTTIAVLAGGLDRPHPAANHALFDLITQFGLLISETPPGITATRCRYRARTRLLAALTCGTVLIEAATGSLAVTTVHTALALGRPAMAVPGPVTSIMSTGSHHVLRDRRVHLVTDARDVLAAVNR